MPPLAEAMVLNGLGNLFLKVGRAEEAYSCASDLMRAVASMGPQPQHAALGFMVDAARAVGRLDEAFEAAERFLGSARVRGTADDTLLRALIDSTNVRIDRGGADVEVDGMLAEAEAIAAKVDASSGTTRWRDELAKIHARRGMNQKETRP